MEKVTSSQNIGNPPQIVTSRELSEKELKLIEQIKRIQKDEDEKNKKLKEPRLMKTVYHQLYVHPRWSNLSEGDRFVISATHGGHTRGGKNDNKFIRKFWRHLYWGLDIDKC